MRILATVLTVLAILLFVATGLTKLLTPWSDLRDSMDWVQHFSQWQVRGIGALELLASIGLLVSFVLRRLLWAARFAPLGLAALMLGAVGTHMAVGDDLGTMAPAIVALVVASLLTWLRWGPVPLEPRHTS